MVVVACIALALAQAAPEVSLREGLRMEQFAREPLIADPVAIWIDDSGRVWVAESERQERGVEDNRSSKFWLMDDLRAQSLEDRLAYYRKWAGRREGGMDYYEAYSDRIRRIEDRDRDGRGDVTVQFSRDFNGALDGTGAGVLVDGEDVWFTCIPGLWRMRDTDGDGVANTHEAVHYGFGVRTALRGHDMHGLVIGPDGRIYWSIGDRGYRVAQPDGREIADLRSGAVFRCRPDGSELEVFCRGLRNPQELAFNEWGDLFTGDNNSDGGDKARLVYLMRDGDSGWDMHAQTLEGANQRGPWNQEGIWRLRTDDRLRPAWTLPPIAHVGSGPSGIAFVPGTGVPEDLRGAFLMCDFLGSAPESGVLAIRAERDGAGYAVRDVEPLVTGLLATDVAFGPDDRIYVSEWGEGWYSTGTGRLQVISDEAARSGAASTQAQAILAAGDAALKAQGVDALTPLLASPDLRVRQKAQFALVARGEAATAALHSVARGDHAAACGSDGDGLRAALLQRIHAVWALGMQAQGIRGPAVAADASLDPLLALLEDPDPEIRAQACRVLGDARHAAAASAIAARVLDEDLRVRASAALALARLGPAARDAVPNVTAMLWENEDGDPFLRHAGATALAGIADPAQLASLASDPFPAVRLGALLALRQRADAAVARFLYDPDPRIVAEAARAIWDVPVQAEWPALASLAARWIPQDGASKGPADAPAAPSAARVTRLAWTRDIWRETSPAARGPDGLISEPAFSRAPSESAQVDEAVGISGAATKYLQRLSASFTPTESGTYELMIACDDDGVLLLGENGGGLREVARVSGYVNAGSWESQASQRSQPVELVAGTRYAIEARHVQGGGGHHLAIGWIRPDGTAERPIGMEPLDVNLAATLRRVIAANAALGGTDNADALAQLAGSPLVPRPMQIEALAALSEFADPKPQDRVIGHVRDRMMRAAADRDAAALDRVLALRLPQVTQSRHVEVRQAAIELATQRGISLDPAASAATASDPSRPVRERVAALGQLAGIGTSGEGSSRLIELRASAIDSALSSPEDSIRTAARRLLIAHDPARASRELAHAVHEGTLREQQAAVSMLATLARSGGPGSEASDETLSQLVDSLGSGVPAALRLDVREAAERVDGLSAKAASACPLPDVAPLANSPATANAGPTALTLQWSRIALEGGDPDAGRAVLQYSSTGSCLRCHALEGTGGHAGPALDGVALRLDSTRLLQALVDPQAEVAAGYGASSAMPAMGALLTPRELRDLVAYLRTLDNPSTKGH